MHRVYGGDFIRLKASFTVENAFVVPCVVIIIVMLVFLDFYMHDIVVSKNAMVKIAMMTEFEQEYKKGTQKKETWEEIAEAERKAEEYLKEKTIAQKMSDVNMKLDNGNVMAECKAVQKLGDIKAVSNIKVIEPDNFIRKINAIKKVTE